MKAHVTISWILRDAANVFIANSILQNASDFKILIFVVLDRRSGQMLVFVFMFLNGISYYKSHKSSVYFYLAL